MTPTGTQSTSKEVPPKKRKHSKSAAKYEVKPQRNKTKTPDSHKKEKRKHSVAEKSRRRQSRQVPVPDNAESPANDKIKILVVVVLFNILILAAASVLFAMSVTCGTMSDSESSATPEQDLIPDLAPDLVNDFDLKPLDADSPSSGSHSGNPSGSYESGSNSQNAGSQTESSSETLEQEDPILTEYDSIVNPNHDCGTPPVQPDLKKGRIVGGAEAVPNSWPYTVGLGVLELKGGSEVELMQMCGATLISPRHALTAAHCFMNDPTAQQPYSVFSAVHSTLTYEGIHPMRVIVIRMHPKTNVFDKDPWLVYDFALLTLLKEFSPTSKIQIACLPTIRKVLPEGSICWAVGWGKTLGTGSPNLLKQVAIDIVSEKTCQQNYHSGIELKSTLCGGTTAGQDTCQGDSGGPLFCQENGKWVLHGVTSYGPKDCGGGPMAAYGTVSYNLEWICCYIPDIPSCQGIKCVPSGEN